MVLKLTMTFSTAEDRDNKLMSSEGLEATEAEMNEVLHDVDMEVAAATDEAIAD